MKILGVCGLIGSGKGTVSDYLVNELGYEKLSYASPLKDAVSDIFGWDRALLEGDTDESRKFRETVDEWWTDRLKTIITPRLVLQRIGTESMRNGFHTDIWVYALAKSISNADPDKKYVISDVRFDNEIRVIDELGGDIIEIQRSPLPDFYQIANNYNVKRREIVFIDPKDSFVDPPMDLDFVHRSEWEWIGHPCVGSIITNNGTKEELLAKIAKFATQ